VSSPASSRRRAAIRVPRIQICGGSGSTSTPSSATGRCTREIHEVFNADYPPSSLHRLLARLSAMLRKHGREQLLVLTTNYDDLVERAL
jgi:hypothetical protein